MPRISTNPPPAPDDEHLAAESASRNGASAPVRSETIRRLIVLGYITAVAMPPIGFTLALVLAIRHSNVKSMHPVWIVLVCLVASVIWLLVFKSGALSSTNNGY